MDRLNLAVSPFFKSLLEQNPGTFASWIQPVRTNHIWRADLAGHITAGTHRIIVRTEDQFGHIFTGVKVIEVKE